MKRFEMSLYVKKMREAIDTYQLIVSGDRILVGLSGGKDSLLLVHGLERLKHLGIYDFEFKALVVNNGFMNDTGALESYLNSQNIDYDIYTEPFGLQIDFEKEKNPCFGCARQRRGILSRIGVSEGFNKIALGHTKDDLIDTFYMNLIMGGRLKSIYPKTCDEDTQIEVIRPLIYVYEKDVQKACEALNLPVTASACPVDTKTKRTEIGDLVEQMEALQKGFKEQTFQAIVKDLIKSAF